MAPSYTQYTLNSLTTEISNLLDDTTQIYWTPTEIQYAIQEALFVWGALTSYWRSTGTFNTVKNTAFYDLSVQMPTLRTREWTLNQLTSDIQYAILEAPNGISGAGMSGQTSIMAILNAINRARNRFVLDSVLPFTIASFDVPQPPPDGIISFSDTIGYVHTAKWQDGPSGTWYTLWRQDNYAADASLNTWLGSPQTPRAFTESNDTPLDIQLVPPPAAAGVLESLSVKSLMLDLTNPNTLFNLPDEWVHAVKWGALAELLSAESKINDPLRAQYAAMRYQQSVDFAKNAKSIIRARYGSTPLMIDTLFAIDSGQPTWKNQQGPPKAAGILYDVVGIVPGSPQSNYLVTIDVVESAPIPINQTDYIEVGPEDIGHLIDYILHILTFKCGGKEFQATYARYNAFMGAVSFRNQINKAKIKYLKPTIEQPSLEEGERPDVWNLQQTGGSK